MVSTVYNFSRFRIYTAIICTIGFMISAYGYHVSRMKSQNANYRALCDINEHVSCSKVFTTRYGKGFGVLGSILGEKSVLNQSNVIFGMVFYMVQLGLDQSTSSTAVFLQMSMSVGANLMSVYLAYLLAFVLRNFCFVCVVTYVLNALLLFCNVQKYRLLATEKTKTA